MLFVDLNFFLFFALVLAVYWNLPANGSRKGFLLASSYFFYACWDWRFAGMLAVISFGDYFFARRIDASTDDRKRRRFVIASVAMNLGVLAYFKYCKFFVHSAFALAGDFGISLDEPTLDILLPVGVSFFTFQSLSYTIDVYRREIRPAQSALDYLLFAAFFPQLVAGPIVRPKVFLPQLSSKRTVDFLLIRSALLHFAWGFLKKSAIADNISPYVDAVFQSPADYTNLAVVSAVWLYAVQIFCDFSGYSDMAIAVAALMGFELVPNFDAPYLATSLQAFWRRWHISLSSWIRDYIYVSLGGRNVRRAITYRNLVLTMLAGGLWHGAAWTFVAWGGLHGLGLVVQQEIGQTMPGRRRQAGVVRSTLGWLLTLQFVCICWILFRAPSFSVAMDVIARYCHLTGGGAKSLPLALFALPPFLLAMQYLAKRFSLLQRIDGVGLPAFAAGLGATAAFAIAMLPLGHRPFIYFQF